MGRSITFLKIIRQGPLDTIIVHFQNKDFGVNGERFYVIPMEPRSETTKTLIFF